MPADVIVEGPIATLAGDEGFGWVEALAVTGGQVEAAGAAAEIGVLAGPGTTRFVLEPGHVAIPGFTDAHLHLGDAALAAQALDLRNTRSLAEALELVARRHSQLPDGEWLFGFGWQPAVWGRWPSAADLEAAAPRRAAFLWSHDHHAAWLSATALAAAGLASGSQADPPGGKIGHDASGHPNGILHENAVRLAADAIPATRGERLAAAIQAYAASLLELGIVAVHDPGPLAPDPDLGLDMAACTDLASRGLLPIRVHVSVRSDSLETAIARGLRSGDDLLSDAPMELRGRCRVGWLKLFADGALGSRTAAMLEPYRQEAGVELPAGETGMLTTSEDELRSAVRAAAAAGIATQIHAIGDRAVRAALDAFEEARGGPGAERNAPQRALLPRIEHAQLVDPSDLARFGSLGVVASVQPSHLKTDAAGAVAAWGDRAEEHGYPYGELQRAGAILAFGSDAPVETADPWLSLAFAINRARSASEPGLGGHQALSAAAAVRASCIGPSIAAGRPLAGRLLAGSPADILVVEAESLRDPAERRPVAVFTGGVQRL